MNKWIKSKYDNIQHTQAFTSVSHNLWHTFLETQGSEEANLKNTDVGVFFLINADKF
jgi:hypothetical protein